MERNGVQLIDFYMQSIENRTSDGEPTYVDKEFIRITSPGGKEAIEREVKPEDKVVYIGQYNAFKNGVHYEGEGFKLKDVSFLSKAEIENCQRAKVYTVEQLASMDDIGAKAVGLGAQTLRQKAQNWLEGKKNIDSVVSKVNALEQQIHSQKDLVNTITTLKSDNEKKDIKISDLQNQIEELMKKPLDDKKKK